MFRQFAALAFILALSAIGFAQDSGSQKGRVKADTQFIAEVEKGISSESSSIGEDVNFIVKNEVAGEGITILAGSELFGRIVNVERFSENTKVSKISIMFDFIQSGEEFMSCKAVITAIDGFQEAVEFDSSETFEGGTVLSLAGKELSVKKGTVFRIRLIADIEAN